MLAGFRARGVVPLVVSVHTFTPRWRGFDAALARRRALGQGRAERAAPDRGLRARAGLVVGDNEPYSGKHPSDYTIDHHAEPAGLPHLCIEVRQDQLESPAGIERWVRLLARLLARSWPIPDSRRLRDTESTMAIREPPLTLGIEEEYLLVDRATGAVAAEPPDELFAALHERTAGRAFPEFLRAQVEVATPVCRDIAEARRELGGLRAAVIEEAERFGLAPIAASSHPFSLTVQAEAHRQGALRRAARGDAGRRAPHDDLRPARARRHRGRRPAHRPDEPAARTSCRTCSRCRAARRSGKASARG